MAFANRTGVLRRPSLDGSSSRQSRMVERASEMVLMRCESVRRFFLMGTEFGCKCCELEASFSAVLLGKVAEELVAGGGTGGMDSTLRDGAELLMWSGGECCSGEEGHGAVSSESRGCRWLGGNMP